MTSLNSDGLIIQYQDLSTLSPSSDDDGRLYLHDGSSSITTSGGESVSAKGYYMWDESSSGWHPLKMTGVDAGTLNGYDSDAFAILSEANDFTVAPTINGNSIFHVGNKPGTGELSFDPATQSELDNHSSDTSNPHSVTAGQAGAIPDSNSSVSESHLSFDTATQSELDSHTSDTKKHRSREAESGNIELASSDSPFVFHRQHVPSGKTLYVYEMGLQDEANTAPSGVAVEAYDETNGVSLASKTTKYAEATPIASKDGAIDVSFRLDNSSAATSGYSGFVVFALA